MNLSTIQGCPFYFGPPGCDMFLHLCTSKCNSYNDGYIELEDQAKKNFLLPIPHMLAVTILKAPNVLDPKLVGHIATKIQPRYSIFAILNKYATRVQREKEGFTENVPKINDTILTTFIPTISS